MGYYDEDRESSESKENPFVKYAIRAGHYGKQRYKERMDNLVDYGVESAERFALNKLKNHFGKEYKIRMNALTKDSYVSKFIKKFDKEYDKHFSENNYNDFVTMIPLEFNTYMYMASGRFTPGKMMYAMMNKESEDIYLYICGRKARKYCKIFESAMKRDAVKDKGGLIFSVSKVQHDNYGITSMPLPKKQFSQLFFSNGEIDIIKKHLDRFKETQEMYASKQLPYKTGILLYGEPGTGKTSLVKAIATEYGRSIATITVSRIEDIDFTELATLFDNDNIDTYVILFEDIDTINNALSSREEKKTKVDNDDPDSPEMSKKKTRGDVMNALMQFLDGVNSPNNVIFVATTNYINELDAAFTRAGRFDLKLEIKGLYDKDAIAFCKSFGLNEHDAKEVIESYKKDNPKDTLLNQAKLQGYIIDKLG